MMDPKGSSASPSGSLPYPEAIALLSKAKSSVILSHVSPDPDAYGSICSLALFLEENISGHSATLVNVDSEKVHHPYIPGSERVLAHPPEGLNPDVVIVCDSGELNRIGDELASWVLRLGKPIVNIDHHQSNPNFGEINLVEVSASSTCEILFCLFEAFGKNSKCSISAQVAEALLAGILGDTGGFRYRSTTAETLRRAAVLMDCGARLDQLTRHLFGSVPLASLKLSGIATQKMHLFADNRIAGACITEEDYQAAGATAFDGDDIAELLRDIEGVEISYSIRRMEEKWKASLRTVLEDVDLSEIARSFGGGGHRAAAAFRASGEISDIVARLEISLQNALQHSKLSRGGNG